MSAPAVMTRDDLEARLWRLLGRHRGAGWIDTILAAAEEYAAAEAARIVILRATRALPESRMYAPVTEAEAKVNRDLLDAGVQAYEERHMWQQQRGRAAA